VLHSQTEHIEVKYHFLRDYVEKGNVDLIHVPTEKEFADILTKPLDQATFARLRGELQLGWLMYIYILHFHLCIISCLRLCIIDCIYNICHRDVLLSYALLTMIC
jgi:hypothetical protein